MFGDISSQTMHSPHLLDVQNVVKTNVVIAKTGVKFVHAAAHAFDVGVYFEANGHGTVLFGPKFYDFMATADARLRGKPRHDRANIALRRLRTLPALVNQSVGDAMSDMLLVDSILYLRGWDLNTWAKLYEDMPSKQAKVKVSDSKSQLDSIQMRRVCGDMEVLTMCFLISHYCFNRDTNNHKFK